jgi:hypothetical protein
MRDSSGYGEKDTKMKKDCYEEEGRNRWLRL